MNSFRNTVVVAKIALHIVPGVMSRKDFVATDYTDFHRLKFILLNSKQVKDLRIFLKRAPLLNSYPSSKLDHHSKSFAPSGQETRRYPERV